MIDFSKLDAEDVGDWLAHPVTEFVVRSLAGRLRETQDTMQARALMDQPVGPLAGRAAEIRELLTDLKTAKGAETE